MNKYDVAIIGAGVVGLCIANELSRYKLNVACVEKENTVALGASGNNSGVIHSGINLKPGSMKAKFCVQGNRMMYGLCESLKVPCRKTGTLVVAADDEEMRILEELKKRADLNGIEDAMLVTREEIKRVEPHIVAENGLLSPSGGITLPRMLCRALADNAVNNGVKFYFTAKVSGIEQGEHFALKTMKDPFNADVVINSAGLYADEIGSMVGYDRFTIQPWLGEYYLIDRGDLVNSMVYPAPQFGGAGLGIHLTKSLEGHILVGPNATKMNTKDHRFVSPPSDFYDAVSKFLPEIRINDLKYGYSGIRAKLASSQSLLDADFVIEEYPRNFVHLMGIESPGLTSSPAIARQVVEMIRKNVDLQFK